MSGAYQDGTTQADLDAVDLDGREDAHSDGCSECHEPPCLDMRDNGGGDGGGEGICCLCRNGFGNDRPNTYDPLCNACEWELDQAAKPTERR